MNGFSDGPAIQAAEDGEILSVVFFEQGPINVEGVAPESLYAYRWVVRQGGDWTFDGSSELHIDLSEVSGLAVTDPTSLVVYRRDLPGGGTFTPLATGYDDGSGEVVATGFSSFGEFVLATGGDAYLVYLPLVLRQHVAMAR